MAITEPKVSIHGLGIRWWAGYGNSADIDILAERSGVIPFIYQRGPNGLYFGRAGLLGLCSILWYRGPGNDGGCGGSVFNLTMIDGGVKRIEGPWIGSCWEMGVGEYSDFPEIMGSVMGSGAFYIEVSRMRELAHCWAPHIVIDRNPNAFGPPGPFQPRFPGFTHAESKELAAIIAGVDGLDCNEVDKITNGDPYFVDRKVREYLGI